MFKKKQLYSIEQLMRLRHTARVQIAEEFRFLYCPQHESKEFRKKMSTTRPMKHIGIPKSTKESNTKYNSTNIKIATGHLSNTCENGFDITPIGFISGPFLQSLYIYSEHTGEQIRLVPMSTPLLILRNDVVQYPQSFEPSESRFEMAYCKAAHFRNKINGKSFVTQTPKSPRMRKMQKKRRKTKRSEYPIPMHKESVVKILADYSPCISSNVIVKSLEKSQCLQLNKRDEKCSTATYIEGNILPLGCVDHGSDASDSSDLSSTDSFNIKIQLPKID